MFEQGEITEFLKIMKGEKSKSELERSGEITTSQNKSRSSVILVLEKS